MGQNNWKSASDFDEETSENLDKGTEGKKEGGAKKGAEWSMKIDRRA